MGHDLSRMPSISARLNRMFAAWGEAALPRRLARWRTVLGGTAAAAIVSVVVLLSLIHI